MNFDFYLIEIYSWQLIRYAERNLMTIRGKLMIIRAKPKTLFRSKLHFSIACMPIRFDIGTFAFTMSNANSSVILRNGSLMPP